MIDDMAFRNVSPNTQKVYAYAVADLRPVPWGSRARAPGTVSGTFHSWVSRSWLLRPGKGHQAGAVFDPGPDGYFPASPAY